MTNSPSIRKREVYTVCLDCGKKYKTKEKSVMGIWIDDCDICGKKQVSCAAAVHDFGIYEMPSVKEAQAE